MGKNRKTEVTRQLGGAMEPGIHDVTCIEYYDSGDYRDYILENKDRQLHKERIWGRFGWSPGLGSKWRIELYYAGDGRYRIERGGDIYYLIEDGYNRVVYNSDRIRNIYAHVKEKNFKLKYLKVKWRKPLEET